jgi:hypothetical protein
MVTCSDFPEGSRKWHICNGTIDMPLSKINVYRAQYGEPPLTEKPPTTYQSPNVATESRPVKTRTHIPPVRRKIAPIERATGGPGTELIAIMEAKGVPSCQQCKDLAVKMDEWGPVGCNERMREIVDDIYPRAEKWVAENRAFISTFLPNAVKEPAIRLMIRNYVLQAIDQATGKVDEAKKKETTASPVLWRVAEPETGIEPSRNMTALLEPFVRLVSPGL